VLGFAGAFRRSELVALDVAELTETPDRLRVRIRRSKTDQEGQGAEIAIPCGYRLRPVEAVQAWLAAAEISAVPSIPSRAEGPSPLFASGNRGRIATLRGTAHSGPASPCRMAAAGARPAPARAMRERQGGVRMNGLAAAIAEIRELYERECAGLTEPIDTLERDEALPRQRADWDAERAEMNEAKARTARAVAALASEHEQRMAAEVERDRLRAEVEGERERTREALEHATAAVERWQQAEAEVIQLRHETEARHHQAEQEHARLMEEADGLGQRLQAAERDVAQLRQTESAHRSSGRWGRLSTTATLVLSGAAVAALSAWLLFPEPAKDRIISAVSVVQTSWVAAKEKVLGKSQPTTTPVPQPTAPNLGAGQPRALAATPIGSGPRANSSGQEDSGQKGRGDSSQSRPQISGNQQQPPAPPAQEKIPAPSFAPLTSASADALSEARHIQPQASDSVPRIEQTENAQAKVAPQPELTPPPSPQPSRLPTSSASPPTSEVSVSDAAAAHVSIHYRQGTPSGRADAERVATWLVSSGFGASQLLGSQHAPREQVVRYFFAEDAEVASRIVGELRKKGGRWRSEDCTHFRHKPRAGSIEVWRIQIL
jgi:hypothetical protein